MNQVIDLEAQKRNAFNPWKLWDRFTITGQDGSPYLIRLTIIGTPWFAIMHHAFLRSDADRCLHDHPWPFVSIILSGGYFEDQDDGMYWRPPGSILFRRAEHRHRVILTDGEGFPETTTDITFDLIRATSLVIRGPKQRSWGFWTAGGWRHWVEFIDRKNAGENQC